MTKIDYIENIESALIDVLDGNSKWYEIQEQTGLSEERCKEIEEIFYEVLNRYNHKHGITNNYKIIEV